MSQTGQPDETFHVEVDAWDEYSLWCELNPCPACEGLGSDDGDGEDDSGFYCGHCDGTGIDPDAEYTGPHLI